ncbi:MAG: hypothetical protein H7A09_07575 [Oceanospirillaceae bacterium]|nr:hypothetical protein [Oceanospirillaceae bacterium]MCP5349767.1 hypothetical protein [Oceanospirillaceae bacterium]
MKLLSAILFTIVIVGCSSMPGMPGYIEVTKSSFDGSTQMTMEPAFVYRKNDGFSGSDLQLSLLWRSAMKTNEVVLIAQVSGAQSIARGESLHFNIDGNIESLKSIDELTTINYEPAVYSTVYIQGQNTSSKRYVVSKQFIDKILNASNVKVKLELSQSFVEGIFTDKSASSANGAFKEFVEKAKLNGY